MTNEEKAIKLVDEYRTDLFFKDTKDEEKQIVFLLKEMAEWKDDQYTAKFHGIIEGVISLLDREGFTADDMFYIELTDMANEILDK